MPLFGKKKDANLASENSPKERHDDRKYRSKDAKAENSVSEKVSSPKNGSNEAPPIPAARNSNLQAGGQPNIPSPATRAKMKKQRSAPPKPSAVPPPDPNAHQTPPRFVFYCQLAHGSATAKVEGFTNVKQLYEKIAAAFHIGHDEVHQYNMQFHNGSMCKSPLSVI